MYCVCFTCDNNYVIQVGVAIYSLYENNQDLDNLDTIVFSDRISEENKGKLQMIAGQFGRQLSFVESDEIIRFIKNKGIVASVDDGALSTYVRLFIGSYVDDQYDRLIYIDADTVTLGSIRELCEISLEKPVAAVIDIMPDYYKRMIGFDREYYFNCGVLIIDMQRWKSDDYENRLLSHVDKTIGQYMYGDQDVFNVVLKGNIQILPLQYNFFPFYGEIQHDHLLRFIGNGAYYYTAEQQEEAKKKPVIVHMVYSVADRPWIKGNMNHFQDQWKTYVTKTPWRTFLEKTRKPYSRTRIMQHIYRALGEKAVVVIERKRNERKYRAWEKNNGNH